MFIDSHCHLDFPDLLPNIEEHLAVMKTHQVSHALCISVEMDGFLGIKNLVEKYPNLYGTVGVHPDYENTKEPSIEWLVEQARHPKIIGIGETGLDYFRIGDRGIEDYEWQRDRFRTHIRAACASNKPLIIHTRSASIDTLRIMREEGADKVGGVMHCFTESTQMALEAIDLGFYISFSGIVTFKNAVQVQETCKAVPLERLLIETDSPYLAPIPNRGKTNQPGWVYYVAKFIAELRGLTVEEVGEISTSNFQQLFKLNLS